MHEPASDYQIQQDCFLMVLRLCISRGSFKAYLIQEFYVGRLATYNNKDKTLALLEARFF